MKTFIFNDAATVTAAQLAALTMPFTAEITGVYLRLNTGPASTAATFDVEVAGTSIVNAAISVAAAAVVPTTAPTLRKNGAITGAVAGTAGTAVYTVSAGHLFKVGDLVTVASVTTSGGTGQAPYNFTDKQVSAVTSTTVTVTGIVGTPGAYSSGGTIVCTTSPIIVPAGAILSFDCDGVGGTAAVGYTLAITYNEAADTSKAVGGLDASRF